MAHTDIRDQLDQLCGESVPDGRGDSVCVPDVNTLYSIIEQLVTRVEELESRLS
jgi:hypothetical protein